MKMKIRAYFINRIGEQIGDGSTVTYAESGWKSVAEFQRDRLAHFAHHPREMAEAQAHGIHVVERTGMFGLRRVMDIELGQ